MRLWTDWSDWQLRLLIDEGMTSILNERIDKRHRSFRCVIDNRLFSLGKHSGSIDPFGIQLHRGKRICLIYNYVISQFSRVNGKCNQHIIIVFIHCTVFADVYKATEQKYWKFTLTSSGCLKREQATACNNRRRSNKLKRIVARDAIMFIVLIIGT